MQGFITWVMDGQGWIALAAVGVLIAGILWPK